MDTFYVLIFLAAIILISILALLVYGLIKLIKWARIHPKKATIGFIIGIFITAGFLLYRDYHKKYIAPYRFWNELLAKNPIPFLVSQKEFEEKNKQGYCWRDRKYYDKDELLAKAKASFIELLQADAVELRKGRILSAAKDFDDPDNYEYLDTDGNCKRSEGNCRVHVLSKETKFSDFIQENKNSPNFLLKEISQYQYSSITASDKYVKTILKSNNKNYTIFPITYGYGVLFPSDCCKILDGKDFIKNKNSHLFSGGYLSFGFISWMYPGSYFIPTEKKLSAKGIGKYALELKSIYIDLDFDKNYSHPYEPSIYLISNCGDILHTPTYNPK